ncbi:transposase [Candidatus Wolfebacteria bacterium]|nr:transposase [Candidatus Wolfebacteria bacterium]
MKLSHKKSQCCAAKIVRFGGKRRRCNACKKTWSECPAKRGPKSLRQQGNYLRKVFNHGFRVKQLSLNSRLSVEAIYKRFANNLASVVKQKSRVRIHGQKLILIIDAEWHYFRKELWTLYFLAAKPSDSSRATILDPLLRRGKENSTVWAGIINQLPGSVKKRVIALISDGIRGIENVAEKNDWIIQRCHFHLLSMLQKMRGKRATTPGRLIREEIYSSVKLALSETSMRRLNILCRRLAVLAHKAECPKRMKLTVRGFLRYLSEFRSYLDYPELKLPITANVMESVNSIVREKTRTVNTPKSWHKWAIACVRFKSKFSCK